MNFNLKEHLKEEHKITLFQTYLKEIVYGGNDGIVTTFAVVAGFAGAQANNAASLSYLTVLLFGLANLFADGASMAMGNYLSLRSEKDVYKAHQKKERYEIHRSRKMEKEETIEILKTKGFTPQQAKHLTEIFMTNEKYWLQFMMNDELEMSDPTKENPFLTALATFISFLLFGFIPLIPYILMNNHPYAFIYSSLAAFSALLLLGLLRWTITRINLIRTVSEIVLVGSTAAIIAYLVGTFFKL